MSKKVLIVESSLAVRGIAESLLRQNGYEVFAADTVAAAREILNGSAIELLLVASDMHDESGRPYFETLSAEGPTAELPLLILHDSSAGGEIAYPPEAVINKPFTPRDFLEAVALFGGGQTITPASSTFNASDLEDAIIDSALGLDKIEVADTEVLGEASSAERKEERKDEVESMIGYEYEVKADESTKIPPKEIEAINVPPEAPKTLPDPDPAEAKADQEFLGQPDGQPTKKPADSLSESSKIEIVTDQYGISLPEESLEFHDSGEGGTHDYDWFLKELRKESSEEAAPGDPAGQKPAATPKPAAGDQPPQSPAAAPPRQEQVPSHTEAVDKFISEFRKEMEKITGDTPGNIEVTNIAAQETTPASPKPETGGGDNGLAWEEGLERVTPADIRLISRQLVEMMAGEIAEKIVARLDEEIIYHLIQESVDNLVKRHAAEKSRKR